MSREKKTYLLEYGGKKQKFARSVVAGDFVFLSGSSGRTIETGEVSSNDAREQTNVALEKVKIALEEAGSCLENIIKVQIMFKDMKDYETVKQAEYDFYKKKLRPLPRSRLQARSGRLYPCPNLICLLSLILSPYEVIYNAKNNLPCKVPRKSRFQQICCSR
ncbi:MAG: RidA family protein [Deltaproteobacteria bacterium]|nr:RidA family protein [Deltaproteobacteria bacterium]